MGLPVFPIHIGHIGHGLEGIKTDAQGQDDFRNGYSQTGHSIPFLNMGFVKGKAFGFSSEEGIIYLRKPQPRSAAARCGVAQ